MYKKQGELARAELWISKALTIKPGGHMGLGDFYLRMIQWQKSLNSGKRSPVKNFLGIRYDAGAASTAAAANREHVITLIKNDVGFADAYVVLGDILFVEENYQLALRAYYRASYLTAPNGRKVRKRQERILDLWKREMKPGFVFEDQWQRQLDEEISAADQWLSSYKTIEAYRIKKGESVGFAEMKKIMSISHPKPIVIEAVYYSGEKIDESNGNGDAVVWVGIVFGLCACVLVFLLKRRTRIKRLKGKMPPAKPLDGPRYDSQLFGP